MDLDGLVPGGATTAAPQRGHEVGWATGPTIEQPCEQAVEQPVGEPVEQPWRSADAHVGRAPCGGCKEPLDDASGWPPHWLFPEQAEEYQAAVGYYHHHCCPDCN